MLEAWGRGHSSEKSMFSTENVQRAQLHSVSCSVSVILQTQVDVTALIQYSSWSQAFISSQEHRKLAFMFEMKADIII